MSKKHQLKQAKVIYSTIIISKPQKQFWGFVIDKVENYRDSLSTYTFHAHGGAVFWYDELSDGKGASENLLHFEMFDDIKK